MLSVQLEKVYPQFSIRADFNTDAGSISALFGRSGAGKSSIVDMIAGLTRPDAGKIEIDGEALFDAAAGINLPPEKRRVGYVFQNSRLFPHMNVRRNLLYGTSAALGADFQQIAHLLDLQPLMNRSPVKLSGGEQQRVAIGRALLSQPRLLLMDEPLASIDVQRRNEILPFLDRLREEVDLTMLYVSHEIEEVIRLADNMILVSDGTIAASGAVEDIMSRLDLKPLTGRYEAGAVLATTYEAYDTEFGLSHLAFDGGTLRVAGLEMDHGVPVRAHIRARDVSLALSRPADSSILNVFNGKIVEVTDEPGPQVDVLVDIGAPIIARITRKSAHDLSLKPGQPVFTLIKAVAIDKRSLGGQGRTGR